MSTIFELASEAAKTCILLTTGRLMNDITTNSLLKERLPIRIEVEVRST